MLPLEGLRIVAVSQYGAGPFGSLHLADLGAEIIKIEDPTTGGDVSRYVVPHTIERDSLYFQSLNRNKKSITLNLKTSEGQEIFHQLVANADAVFNNLRGDQPAKLGLTYDHLKEYNPRIVCCSLSAFGTTGLRYNEPGYDYIIQGIAGFSALTGEPGGPPTKSGVSVVDFATGFAAALGLMSGVYAAKLSGQGMNIDVSLQDTAVSMLNYLAIWHLNKGFEPKRMANSAHPTFVPCQNFRTKDDWIVIMCNKQKFWPLLCQAIDRPDLADHEMFASIEQRYQNSAALLDILQKILLTKETSEWLAMFKKYGVPSGPINSFEQVFADPQIKEMVVEVDHPIFGKIKEVGCPIKVSGVELQYKAAPEVGADTEEILLNWLKYNPKQLEELRNNGVI